MLQSECRADLLDGRAEVLFCDGVEGVRVVSDEMDRGLAVGDGGSWCERGGGR